MKGGGSQRTAFMPACGRRTTNWVYYVKVIIPLFMLLYAGAFIYFGVTDPNLLRSEKYNLEKMAIEHGLIGDSQIGLHKPEDLPNTKTVDALPSPKVSHD